RKAERTQENSGGARRKQRHLHVIAHRLSSNHREIGIELVNLALNRRQHGPRIVRGSHNQGRPVAVKLSDGPVHEGFWSLAETVVFSSLDRSNDFEAGAVAEVESHLPPDRVLTRPEAARHGLVDNHHSGTLTAVLRTEVATAQEWNAHSLKVFGGNGGQTHGDPR